MRILHLEPWLEGSHAAFVETLERRLAAEWTVLGLPGRHWKWRMRGSAMYFASNERPALVAGHDLLLASSFTPLAELVSLVGELRDVPKVLYFHENQLTYPTQTGETDQRDHHFGFTQLVSASVSDLCLFNSRYNLDSFLAAGTDLVARMPDARPQGWPGVLASRCEVLPVPLELSRFARSPCVDDTAGPQRDRGPIILWNHRWEHDKDPECFFRVLDVLARKKVPFRLVVCGRSHVRNPPVFDSLAERFGSRLLHLGFLSSRTEYADLLGRAHLVVSTARHEFFGVSVLEAVHAGARPVVPDRLAYPELFPARFRYADESDLASTLEQLCTSWTRGDRDLRRDRRTLTAPFDERRLVPRFRERFRRLLGEVTTEHP